MVFCGLIELAFPWCSAVDAIQDTAWFVVGLIKGGSFSCLAFGFTPIKTATNNPKTIESIKNPLLKKLNNL